MGKKAWMRLRYLHPALAADVTPRGFQYVALADESDIDKWIETTFVVKDWDPSMESPGCLDFSIAPIVQKPMFYCFPHTKRFIFRTTHMQADGQAATVMLHDLLSEMKRLDAGGEVIRAPLGEEVQNLPYSAFDSAGITEEQQAKSAQLISSLPEPRVNEEAFEVPSENNALNPGAGKAQTLEFSEEQTLGLMGIAKRLRLGITPLIHAALLHAGKKLSPNSNGTIHSTGLVFSFRELCSGEPLNAASRAAAPRVCFWPVQVEMSDDFQRTARNLKHEYKAMAQRKKADMLGAMPQYLTKSASVLHETYFKGVAASFIGDLSDVFPETYGPFKIRDILMVATPADERIYTGIQTLGKKLFIRACYNQTYHSDSQIAEFLGLVRDCLYASAMLGVEKPDSSYMAKL
ncbi:hypothetical protein BO70DRAFT_389357 [Aspergillus heteromorphus CBS 117.55]|uniref:CoA-dependent acyltransferase n=1 Tax=Aspergillus heteromorphus CBS 117.55 TaxID=1448321 RepID=A0A317VD37_9EURO|nr:uncharacterized protein BO70DRAFT_389357 [Aspergillus heteromorphus CBS 117.55]PWY72283.1 hypothetical protein BO70DRAFT_389357 [Aspergillus heteromorphus CBS 117.55]